MPTLNLNLLMARLLAEDPAVRRFFLTAKQED